ncbi:MAG: metallophosphoesterase [Firmicutes bacterium]|nr:metallophosphoesterase [Bacillota bacterium]
MTDFTPILRFAALSDVHYREEPTAERERMAKALQIANRERLDALCVVGDFTANGSETQFRAFRTTLEEGVRPETRVMIAMAGHEYMESGPVTACSRLRRIFGQAPDMHEVIQGYHFISLSSTRGTNFDSEKRGWAAAQLALAAADDPRRPIFFFQHPHVTGTVYGSIAWGEDELYPLLMNYPQVIDFSGHSHAPINDPRSIHQDYFTSLGCGTLAYFENDEFDKYYGTCPPAPEGRRAAQMLFVEADVVGRVRITPYDILTDQAFPYVWDVPAAWDPASYQYTNAKRRAAALPPYFPEGATWHVENNTLTFDQANARQDYVNDYRVRLRHGGVLVRQIALWSYYYVIPMPETLSLPLEGLSPGEEYDVEITARGFWENESENKLTGRFTAN